MTGILLRPHATRCAASLILLGLAVVPCASAQSAASPASPAYVAPFDTLLDLETVVARALAVSPFVVAGEEQMRVARSEKRVATGAYLPSLAATSSGLRSNVIAPSGTLPVPNDASAYSAGVASSLDLYTGGRRRADRARAEADVTATTATAVSQRYSVTLDASRAYYEALRGADLVSVAQARVARAERGLKYAQDRVRAATATRSDELRARLELTTGRQQLLAARDTLQASAYALGRLVGSNGPVGAAPPPSLEPRPLLLSDSAIVTLAARSSPAVQAAEAQSLAADAGVRSARTQYVPTLRVTGGYNWAGQSPVLGAIRPGWILALGTTYPLFNGFQREDAVVRADASAEIAASSARDATRQARAEAARLVGALHIAEQNVVLAGDAVSAAQEDLRVQTERYRAGISTALDRQTSELAVTQAELGLVAARYNYQVTRATLESLLGQRL
jgi:outer membrane protein TolC